MKELPDRIDAVSRRATSRDDLFRFLTIESGLNSIQTMENLRRLKQPDSVVVVTNLYLSLLGGPVFQLMKCLTSIKLCEELAKRKITAVPVCWISRAAPSDFSRWSVRLLDSELELHFLQLQQSESADIDSHQPMPFAQISAILSQIETLGRGTFDAETLGILRAEFVPGMTYSSAFAHLIAALLKEWGMIVLDPEAPALKPALNGVLAPVRNQIERTLPLHRKEASKLAGAGYVEASSDNVPASLIQCLMMPVIACVIDPHELHSYATELPIFDEIGLPRPMIWPQSSVTIVDARSRRILERYNLGVHHLYAGEEEAIKRIRETIPSSAPGKLERLKIDVERRIAEIMNLDSAGNEFASAANSCKEKITYQIEKLREQFGTAVNRKEQAVSRQIHKACNWLAPNRHTQERELAGIQIPLRYSRAGIRFLYEKLDILKLKHQLIPMD